jgi:hypothetical protein
MFKKLLVGMASAYVVEAQTSSADKVSKAKESLAV